MLKRYKLLGAILFGSVIICSLALHPNNKKISAEGVSNSEIVSFTSDMYLTRNKSQASILSIEENIVVNFPTDNKYHGILRAIPEQFSGHTVSLQINSVTNEKDQPIPYTTYFSNHNRVLKIGDANKFVVGELHYRIKYKQHNVMRFFGDHDEFFWDINGDQWNQIFQQAVGRVHIPADITPDLLKQQRCLAGITGHNDVECQINRQSKDNETIITVRANDLVATQSISVALAFKKGTFKQGIEVAKEQALGVINYGVSAVLLALPPLFSGVYMYRLWRTRGRDPTGRKVIVPQYEPPKDLNVLTSDYISKEELDQKAITALVVELAIKRYINIYEIPKSSFLSKKDYQLELISDHSALPLDVKRVVELFFLHSPVVGEKILLSDLAKPSNRTMVVAKIKKLNKTLGSELKMLHYFSNNPATIKLKYRSRGALMIGVGAAAIFISLVVHVLPLGAIGFGLVEAGIIWVIGSKFMPARSSKGVEVREYLLGLRDYIKMAEAERLKFSQSPDGAIKEPIPTVKAQDPDQKVQLFERLLPYAMIFGLEKKWAKQFQSIYDKPPDWYGGDINKFNVVYLASSLNNFSQSSSATVFSAPSSSSRSGFSGGAGAGGGGGGGGGGSW